MIVVQALVRTRAPGAVPAAHHAGAGSPRSRSRRARRSFGAAKVVEGVISGAKTVAFA